MLSVMSLMINMIQIVSILSAGPFTSVLERFMIFQGKVLLLSQVKSSPVPEVSVLCSWSMLFCPVEFQLTRLKTDMFPGDE